MSHRKTWTFAVLLVAGLGSGVCWLLHPWSAINPQNYEKIRVGMTLAEVEAILGEPGYEVYDRHEQHYCRYIWGSNRLAFEVWLDADGKVNHFISCPIPQKSPLEILQGWLLPRSAVQGSR